MVIIVRLAFVRLYDGFRNEKLHGDTSFQKHFHRFKLQAFCEAAMGSGNLHKGSFPTTSGVHCESVW